MKMSETIDESNCEEASLKAIAQYSKIGRGSTNFTHDVNNKEMVQ